MSSSKRALRRHHRVRLNRRLYKILMPRDWLWHNTGWSYEDVMYQVNRRRDNMQMCSCYSCGNPRHRMEGSRETLTMQEIREEEREKCDWEEVDNPFRV